MNKRVGIRMDEKQYNELKSLADRQNRKLEGYLNCDGIHLVTVSSIVREAVEDYLKKAP